MCGHVFTITLQYFETGLMPPMLMTPVTRRKSVTTSLERAQKLSVRNSFRCAESPCTIFCDLLASASVQRAYREYYLLSIGLIRSLIRFWVL